jgi:hypothetical protein
MVTGIEICGSKVFTPKEIELLSVAFDASYAHMYAPGTAAILFIALIPFFAFKHLSREVGESRMKEMLPGTSIKIPEDGR